MKSNTAMSCPVCSPPFASTVDREDTSSVSTHSEAKINFSLLPEQVVLFDTMTIVCHRSPRDAWTFSLQKPVRLGSDISCVLQFKDARAPSHFFGLEDGSFHLAGTVPAVDSQTRVNFGKIQASLVVGNFLVFSQGGLRLVVRRPIQHISMVDTLSGHCFRVWSK